MFEKIFKTQEKTQQNTQQKVQQVPNVDKDRELTDEELDQIVGGVKPPLPEGVIR